MMNEHVPPFSWDKNLNGARRWMCTCAYDGTEFHGWQSQAHGNTVQDFIEGRLREIFQMPVRIHGAGRTDAGVHARGQVFHFDGHWPHGKKNLHRALLCGFPRSIGIRRICPVPHAFHARFSAVGKRYIYRIYLGHSDPFRFRYRWSLGSESICKDLLFEAAAMFMGTHSFAAFASNRGDGDGPKTTVRTIRQSAVTWRGREMIYRTEGDGYLYKMVRRMVGAMVEVARRRIGIDDIANALSSGESSALFPPAPAAGLALDRVFYAVDALK
ncbi:MAG: tRNA pseudouridine(38-40) synthase TruA [Puniceicoccales bacterium]|nr:tRNA pseudouridine(38-40) synthase TruA [Puniceicoccales bacterium]